MAADDRHHVAAVLQHPRDVRAAHPARRDLESHLTRTGRRHGRVLDPDVSGGVHDGCGHRLGGHGVLVPRAGAFADPATLGQTPDECNIRAPVCSYEHQQTPADPVGPRHHGHSANIQQVGDSGASNPSASVGQIVVTGSAGVWAPSADPSLKAADQISRPTQTELPKSRGGEAGAVALVADDDDAPTRIGRLWEPIRAAGVEPPFEDVAIDDQRTWQSAVAFALAGRPDIDDQGSGGKLGVQVGRLHPVEVGASVCEERVDRRGSVAGVHRGRAHVGDATFRGADPVSAPRKFA